MKITKGTQVRQVLAAPIIGTVIGFSVDQETGSKQVKVQWADGDGTKHERFFLDNEIEEVPAE